MCLFVLCRLCAYYQKYDLDFKTPGNDGSAKLTGAQLTDLYKEFLAKYPVVSIEDPFDQVSAVGWDGCLVVSLMWSGRGVGVLWVCMWAGMSVVGVQYGCVPDV